jgi:hypothetical protein
MPIVLALDIAGRATGACVGGAGRKPAFSTLHQVLDDGLEFGRVGSNFRRWMVDMIMVHKPEHIAFEAPWMPMGDRNKSGKRSGMTSTRIPRLLIGLAFLAEQIAYEFEIECSEAEPSTCRKHFVGHGRPEDPKKAVGMRCALLGWNIHNDHEGDAGALWAYTQAMIDPYFSYQTTPLFKGAQL